MVEEYARRAFYHKYKRMPKLEQRNGHLQSYYRMEDDGLI